MSTSLRFRSRQSERNVENSTAQRWQAAMDVVLCHIKGVCSRYTAHLVIMTVAILVFSARPFDLDIEYNLPRFATPTTAPVLGFRVSQGPVSGRGGARDLVRYEPTISPQSVARLPATYASTLTTSDLYQSPVFHTTIPKRLRREVITYVVEPGDHVGKIAVRFDLEPETIMWANGNLAQNPDLLRPGQELIILPIDGVYHMVVKGDSLVKIADKYKSEVQHIIECTYNNLDPENSQIIPGNMIIVPGGVKPYVARQVTAYQGTIPANAKQGTGIFVWPASGRLTDRFGFRTYSGRWHNGLDISSSSGTAIYATDSGFVTFAGWQKTGYGNIVIIDHRNGFVSYYAHLSTYTVSAGQSVSKGTLIATMGSTGNSTGSHLHFELRYKGVRKNPEMYLP